MDAYRRALLNSFTASNLDRCAERRGDDDWLAARRCDAASLFVAVRGGDCLINLDHAAPVFLNCEQVGDADAMFLGCMDGAAVFAVDAGEGQVGGNGDFIDLRIAASNMNAEHASLLAYAKTLVHWRRCHRHCPACAAPLRAESGGHVLRCGGCGRAQFPRTDPAVIVLVEHAGACLLARQAGWEQQRYSVLAGFVEPGESAEQTVLREVREEAGVIVTALRYHASQPWPFPGALMLGYFAQAQDARIKVDGIELEHAQWFTRDALTRALQQNQLRLSPAISISHRLIEHWFDAESKTPLREVLARCGS
ncbi:MAG: NAD(+) diphosphatase [Gammaproteobacteria bacterium]|nr:NAD(+) diphosphatase [Gammaproteobacteria bacterium]